VGGEDTEASSYRMYPIAVARAIESNTRVEQKFQNW
jgi:hypothetical protein